MDKIECKQNKCFANKTSKFNNPHGVQCLYICLKSYAAHAKSNYRLCQVETTYF